jgi:hypothetical protein
MEKSQQNLNSWLTNTSTETPQDKIVQKITRSQYYKYFDGLDSFVDGKHSGFVYCLVSNCINTKVEYNRDSKNTRTSRKRKTIFDSDESEEDTIE